ncbi:hypothetical protein H8959_006112 [Pygathrix nigripes]
MRNLRFLGKITYALTQKEEELYACQRGCRLFSICQFVDDGIDLNRTKLECESACTEAYSQSDEQYACHLGCQNQLPFAELRQEQLMSLMPKMHLLFPLTLVRSFWSDMMDSAQSFITSSWTFYLQADDGKIVIFQSKPEIQYAPHLEQESTNLRESSLSKMSYWPWGQGRELMLSSLHTALARELEAEDMNKVFPQGENDYTAAGPKAHPGGEGQASCAMTRGAAFQPVGSVMAFAPVPTARMRMRACAVSTCSVLPLPGVPPHPNSLCSHTEAQSSLNTPGTFTSPWF